MHSGERTMFELLSILALGLIMVAITFTMVKMMDALWIAGLGFIPSAWLVTAWGVVSILASSAFVLHLVQILFGVSQ
jgi:hypothetical protein